MKFIYGILIFAISTNIFAAGSASQRIGQIEAERNVVCSKESQSFPICFGLDLKSAPCWTTHTYTCSGEESIQVKIRMKESYNFDLGYRSWKSTSVKIKKI